MRYCHWQKSARMRRRSKMTFLYLHHPSKSPPWKRRGEVCVNTREFWRTQLGRCLTTWNVRDRDGNKKRWQRATGIVASKNNEQANGLYGLHASSTVGFPGLTYKYDSKRLLLRIGPIDEPVQTVVLTSLHAQPLYQSDYLTLQGHPGERPMYETIKRQFYWLHRANDVNNTVRDCPEFLWNKPSEDCRRPLQIFRAGGPLKFDAMDLLRALPRMSKGKEYELVMWDLYWRLMRAKPTSKTTASLIASVFMDHRPNLYGISDCVLTDTGTKLLSKFLQSLCAFLGT